MVSLHTDTLTTEKVDRHLNEIHNQNLKTQENLKSHIALKFTKK